MPFLLATMAALIAGPILYAWARRQPRAGRLTDRVVLVLVALLVVLEFIPHAWREGGPLSLVFVAVGLFGPNAVEKVFHRYQREAHLAAIILAVSGLMLHSIADGAVIADADLGWALPSAVILHTLPIGAGIWWLLAPDFGSRIAAIVLAGMGICTVVGYFVGLSLEAMVGARYWTWFEAVVAGAILHALFGRPHLHAEHEHSH